MDFPGEKLVIKLWETVAEKGVGNLFKPWQMRREGRVSIQLKSEELIMIAQAERHADLIRKGEAIIDASRNLLLSTAPDNTPQENKGDARLNPELANAACEISVADTLRREINTTRALLCAEEALQDDTQEPPNTKVDDDWLFRWRDSASEVSSEELQFLWGKVLAGEVKAPGSFSLRTLEFIRNLSTHEAEAIATLSEFIVAGVIYRDAKENLEERGVIFDTLLSMQDIGVLSGVEAIGMSMNWKSLDESSFKQVLTSNSMALILSGDDPSVTISLPIYKLTTIGQQVLRLGKFGPNIDYLNKVGQHLKGQGVNVVLAKYFDVAPGQIQWFDGRNL
ncbi:DUF2806 domain-containing protein [Cyanobium sp. AMD-g]|uniref:DUF2806 domain-containing protein n=1 Tax=Cyanobium sp. AMD-g TaxID=2823699 RepID=UPI0020CDBD31|nr:DUF2806 domain-containing protein [Cyanobium sp. AMD-g]MCP9930538.1 DUF2806 domain-containing protein [Cyanobium sp. AMD-g]